MLFGHQMAVSVYAVINHVAFANYASTPSSLKATHSRFNIIQAADYSDFTYSHVHEKSAPTRCRYFGNQQFCKDNIVHFLARWKWSPAPTFVAFSSLNENNEPNRGGSHACTGDQLSSSSKDDAIYKNLEKEAAVSSIYSGTDHSQYAQNPENEVILLDKLKAVQLHLLAMEQWNASRLELCHRYYQVSAANLIHYLALKSLDLDQLKEDLLCVGLLNLESINHCVLASLVTGIQMLETLKSNSLDLAEKSVEGLFNDKKLDEKKFEQYTINSTRKKAFCNRELLLGPLQDEKSTHIMVTVGQEAAESETLIHDLLKKGTTIFRINCAHGNPSVWSEIVRRVKRSSQMLEKPCRILMDLAGPKLRTGKMKPGPTVVKISPKKDAFGNVILPAQVWLSPQGAGCPPAYVHPDAVLYVDGQEVLCKLEIGHVLTFSDTRGKQRTLKILKQFPVFGGVGFMAECAKTAYVHSGTKFCVKGSKRKSYVGVMVGVPPVEQFIRLRVGDLLTISRDSSNKQNEVSNSAIDSPRVTCPSGYLFDSVKPGETIAFDDGKIWGLIKGASISEIVVSITHAGPKGTNLGSDKSINIPESNIRFEGLTSKDLVDLDFVATHADMIGVSFIRDVRDVVLLRQELIKRKIQNVGIVLKIETKGGFEKLPLILLEAMKSPNPIGVMIARGDLAVECGWEKLATIQEEILSICSAAHVPVIWATQVLESLIKTGVPTRAEITDVASGKRASCIMLNKGKHILDAVSTLDTILNNSCEKLRSEFRPLVLSSHLF